jgi:hypothetical protein
MNAAPVNKVDVDHTALDAEAESIRQAAESVAAGPLPSAVTDTAPAGPMPATWLDITPACVVLLDVVVMPQWALTVPEKESLSKALADVLDAAFPGGAGDARWSPYIRLALVSAGIVLVRQDPKTGAFPEFGRLVVVVVPAPAHGNPASQ